MLISTTLDEANHLIVQHLIRRYLPPGVSVATIEEACATAQRIGNRHGVPRDAVTYLYTIEHPEQGFAFDVRAVWRCGKLLPPTATHTVILDYEDQGVHGSDQAVRLAVNDWLQSVPL